MGAVSESSGVWDPGDQTISTSSETEFEQLEQITVPRQLTRVIILAWGQLTTGAATTAVTHRVYRAVAGATGAVVGEGNAETVPAAAGSTQPMFSLLVEEVEALANARYRETLQQTGATGNGTVLQSGALVFVT